MERDGERESDTRDTPRRDSISKVKLTPEFNVLPHEKGLSYIYISYIFLYVYWPMPIYI